MADRGNDKPRNTGPITVSGSGPGRWNPESGSRPSTKTSVGRGSRGPKAS